MTDREEWKDVKGFEGIYLVSSKGKVKSVDRYVVSSFGAERLHRGIVLKPFISNKGYLIAVLTCKKQNKKKSQTLHKLVAEVFLKNPNNFLEIDHKDGNKVNNDVSNLEWVSRSENMKRTFNFNRKQGRPMLGKKGEAHNQSKAVKQIYDGVVIKVYGSTLEAQRETGINNANICCACSGRRKTAGGFTWIR